MKRALPALLLISVVFISGCLSQGPEVGTGQAVKLYKSPNCGCCVGHTAYLESNDFEVAVDSSSDLNSIKNQYNIPRSMQSCHTAVIGDYFVEGHVPIEAIEKLLTEKPDIDGITLPGMPAGSPGMPGYKKGDWVIYALKDGVPSEFMRI